MSSAGDQKVGKEAVKQLKTPPAVLQPNVISSLSGPPDLPRESPPTSFGRYHNQQSIEVNDNVGGNLPKRSSSSSLHSLNISQNASIEMTRQQGGKTVQVVPLPVVLSPNELLHSQPYYPQTLQPISAEAGVQSSIPANLMPHINPARMSGPQSPAKTNLVAVSQPKIKENMVQNLPQQTVHKALSIDEGKSRRRSRDHNQNCRQTTVPGSTKQIEPVRPSRQSVSSMEQPVIPPSNTDCCEDPNIPKHLQIPAPFNKDLSSPILVATTNNNQASITTTSSRTVKVNSLDTASKQTPSGSKKTSPRDTPERSLGVRGQQPLQDYLSVDDTPKLHISEDAPLRLRRLSRNHSLKYSGGALHDLNQPNSFDHTFQPIKQDSHNFIKGGSLSPRRSPIQEQESEPDTPVRHMRPRSARKLVRHSSIHNEDDLVRTFSDGVLRSRALPPLVRIHTEPSDSPRMPRTRGSYSLSRTDRREISTSNVEDDTSDGGSDRSASPFGNSLQVSHGGGVFKSASMSNMSALSSDSTAINEARKRSYLVGSVGPTSLLGTQELEKLFPDRKLRIFIGTWNMNGQVPPRHLAEFLLPANLNHVPDILVVGTQEVFPEKAEWEIRLQDTLGPSHVLFHSASLGTLHLAVFLKRDLIWYCSIPEDDSFSTRPGSQFKTKGAVAVGFIIFGTSLLFVNSHLTAHQENVKDRVRDLKKIYAVLNLPKTLPLKKRRDMFDSFDCVFWCGDLNFRLEQTREEIIRDMEDGVCLLESDQLTWLMSEGTVFRGFREHPIGFRPTYKYDPGTDNFDTSSKQRIPSYTDRILYKHQPACRVSPLNYDSVQGVTTSDHKPVWGMFEVVVRPGKDSVPLAGGLFNRQVYLEGLKRRSETLKPHIGKSVNVNNMCVLS